MNIIIELIKNNITSEIVKIEMEKEISLNQVRERISKQLNINAMLLPISNEVSNIKTLNEYLAATKKFNSDIHFKVVDCNSLSKWELTILISIAVPASTKPLLDLNRTIRLLSKTLPQEVLESFIVRFGDIVTMFGLTAWDKVTECKGRKTLQIHPYSWSRVGASAVIIYKDVGNIPYVLLVYNKRSDKRPLTDSQRMAGIPSDWKVPEGYLNAKPCKSTDPALNGIIEVSDDAEELLLSGSSMEKAYSTFTDNRFSTGEAMVHGVLREVKEEVGLSYSPSQTKFVHQLDQYQRPMITNIYFIKAGVKSEPPPFKVDGIEIIEAMWTKLHAFQFEINEQQKLRVVVDYYDDKGDRYPVEVTMMYALILGRAIQKFRESEIQQTSSLFENRKNVEAKIKRILTSPALNPTQKTLLDILGPSPESHLSNCSIPGNSLEEKQENLSALASLGKAAVEYHKKLMALVMLFNRTCEDKLVNTEQMINFVTEGLEIEANFLRRKFCLFSLSRNPLSSPSKMFSQTQSLTISPKTWI